jgi:hypothetical protein
MIQLIHSYDKGKHPVGFTVPYSGGDNKRLFASSADWISPNAGTGGFQCSDTGDYRTNPPANTSTKVVISDTDHLWGDGGDRTWAWKSFTRGLQPIFMDGYNATPGHPFGNPSTNWKSSTFVSLRQNLGYIKSYADRMNLVAMAPRGDLTSTKYALANPINSNGEYLVYAPLDGSFTVNLTSTRGNLSVEWFNPSTGITTSAGTITGGAQRQFTPPFSGDAVLYLSSVKQHRVLGYLRLHQD